MGKICCMKHPSYDGKKPPLLSCPVCCSIYVSKIVSNTSDERDEINGLKEWIHEKAKPRKMTEKNMCIDNFLPEHI